MRDWRSAVAYGDLDNADPADFAWEFLRRNPAYQAGWLQHTVAQETKSEASSTADHWGLERMVDPALSTHEVSVPWTLEAFPRRLTITNAVPAQEQSPAERAGTVALRVGDVGLSTVRTEHGAFYLRVLNGDAFSQPELRIEFDGDAVVRLAEAIHFVRFAHSNGQQIPRDALTALQRTRFSMELRALDGSLSGASYRTIAEDLFALSKQLRGAAWKTHDIRSRTIRLVTNAKRLMHSGYKDLLRIPPRR